MRFLRRGGGEAEQPDRAAARGVLGLVGRSEDGIAADIERGTVAGRAPEISSAVDALHSKLAWELSPGSTAKHALVVSPEGNASSAHRAPLGGVGAGARRHVGVPPVAPARAATDARDPRHPRVVQRGPRPHRAGTRAGSCSPSASGTRRSTASRAR